VGAGAILGGAFGGIGAAITGGNPLDSIFGGAISGALVSAAVYGGYRAYQWLTSTGTVEAATGGTDRIRVFARPATTNDVEIPGAYHTGFEVDGIRYEMGPDAAGNQKLYSSETGLLRETAEALQRGTLIWHETTGNKAALLADVVKFQEGAPYRWWFNNSNAWAAGMVSGVGGNPVIPGIWAPAFAPGSGPVPVVPFVWVPELERR